MKAKQFFVYGSSVVLFIVGIVYSFLPSTPIPAPPAGNLPSREPADLESPYRSAYFTNLSRQEIMAYYKNQFPALVHLNHPPEDSYTLIRDQTRSSWLEELVNPAKNSLYINGYYPTKPTEQINRNGQHYAAKITIKYVPSSKVSQLTAFALMSLGLGVLLKQYIHV